MTTINARKSMSVLVLLLASSGLAPGETPGDPQGEQKPVRMARTHNPMLQAVYDGNNDWLWSLLKSGYDPNSKDHEGTPLLMNAVLYADADAVRMLLEKGADPNAANAAKATAIIWAAGDLEKTALLIHHGADVNARSAPGRTALMAAAQQDGAAPVARLLLERGARIRVKDEIKGQPNIPSGSGGASPLIEAAKARDGQALKMLLGRGADVNVRDTNGGSPLTEAIVFGNHENARLLIERGADVNHTATSVQFTPLMYAAMRNNFGIAKILIDRGADVNAKDAGGSTVLMWAAYSSEVGDPRLVDLLLESGADPNVKNRKGETALTWASWNGSTPLVRYLKLAGAQD